MRKLTNLFILICIFAVMVAAQVPWNLDRIDQRQGRDGMYIPSFAAPHISGLAAIYLEHHPFASPQEVQSAIISNATPDVILGANPNLFIYEF